MLHTLELRDFAIVDALELVLSRGFNALTGETGAGKSILIDALGLLVGDRADSASIRAGQDRALVQGVFEGGPTLSAARRLNRNGRHSARLDGELVTVSELAERLRHVIAIFGQHAATELQNPSRQRDQLDRLLPSDAADALSDYREGYARWHRLEQEVATLRREARERERTRDTLRYQRDEIDGVAPRRGEDDALAQEAAALGHAERILESTGRAFAALSDAEGNAVERAAEALRDLRDAARYDASLDPLARDLGDAADALGAVAAELEGFLSEFQADPGRLDTVQARLARLDGLKRKYGDTLDAVLAYRERAESELARLDHVEDDLQQKERDLGAVREALERSAARVRRGREAAAEELTRRIGPLLGELGMPHARFEVEVSDADGLGPAGTDRVRFGFVAHPGEPVAPLASVASGGELSRIMLALHVITGSDVPVLAFDEVDAGIGGRTARAVGALLRRLSEDHQVLVVTHLPQVAAFAHSQFAVGKDERGGRTVTRVHRLDGEARLEELARMLSGTVTETSLRHARELLGEAQRPLPKAD